MKKKRAPIRFNMVWRSEEERDTIKEKAWKAKKSVARFLIEAALEKPA